MPVAEVSGAGIAGLTAAVLLARRGWKVRVHERSPELRASGNGITIFENGIRVLEALDLAPDVVSHGHQLNRFVICRNTGETVIEYDPQEATGGRIVMFQRQEIVDLLSRAALAAGARISLASRVVGADPQGALLLEGGERLEADLVIGADGIHSNVRRSVAGDLTLGKHRKGAIRMLIPTDASDFPDGNLYMAREFNHPNGRRVGILPCSTTVSYMILVSLRSDTPAHAVPIDPSLWEDSFPTLGRFFARVGTRGHYDAYHSISPPSWHFGRCALVGDAAHGMTPALGQGACSSMMTAYALGSANFETAALDTVLSRWEAGIRPLIDFTQKFAEGITEGRLDPNNEVFFADPSLRPILEADIPRQAREQASEHA
ncbi:FAD-dependent oxidoreductase [Phreatobacter sp.]|uniref:FAD-dependent oxidoreductase n=1 Tax=Phreatobacter sp. TaxID=1966341 RepID=UPI003F7295D6